MRLDATALATLLALQEVAGGADIVDHSHVDVERDLSTEQTRFLRDPSQTRVVLGGRRAGKSVAFRRALLKAALEFPGRISLYISLTRSLAKKNLWAFLKADCGDLGIEYSANETELILTIEGGGSIMLGGADDSQAIERYRGLSYVLVIIDECGSQSTVLLKTLVRDVLEPALMDWNGSLVMGGTPGFQLDGFWFDMSGPQRHGRHPLYQWTIYDNPLFRGRADDELAKIREANGWTEDSVTYRREYLGEWIQDASVLVYPFDPAKNVVAELPTRSTAGHLLLDRDWTWRLTVDVGFVDACAFTMIGANRALQEVFIVKHEQHTGMLTSHVADKIRNALAWARQRLPNGNSVKVIMDAGGMGKIHAEEMTMRFGILLQPAEKTEKKSAIRDFRDRLIVGWVKLVDGECGQLIEEWSRLGWDDKREQHDPNGSDHGSDSAIYGDRDLKHFRWDPGKNRPQPKYGTPERFAADEQAALDREERMAMRQQGRRSWNR